MDNTKHLILSTSAFRLPANTVVEFSAVMSSTSINATPRDYRDGFASLVMVDMASGFVFDVEMSSDAIFAVHERLPDRIE